MSRTRPASGSVATGSALGSGSGSAPGAGDSAGTSVSAGAADCSGTADSAGAAVSVGEGVEAGAVLPQPMRSSAQSRQRLANNRFLFRIYNKINGVFIFITYCIISNNTFHQSTIIFCKSNNIEFDISKELLLEELE